MKDYLAFHQNMSIAMGTSLQHRADRLFVNIANLILLRRNSYLEHVKPGIKPDTWNQLIGTHFSLDTGCFQVI